MGLSKKNHHQEMNNDPIIYIVPRNSTRKNLISTISFATSNLALFLIHFDLNMCS